MSKKSFPNIGEMDAVSLMRIAGHVQREIELRGLPDVSFKQGYKAGFIAALRDEDIGPGQVWTQNESAELFKELDRRFAA